MVNSPYRRFYLAIFALGIGLSFAAILQLTGVLTAVGPIVTAPCPCGGRCCREAADPPGMRAADPVDSTPEVATKPPSIISITDVDLYKWQFDGTPGIRADAPVPKGVPPYVAIQVEVLGDLQNQWSVDLIDLYDVTAHKRVKSTSVWSCKGQPGHDPNRPLTNFVLSRQDHEYRIELYLYPGSDDAIRERHPVIDAIKTGKGLRIHTDFVQPGNAPSEAEAEGWPGYPLPLEIEVLRIPEHLSLGGMLK